VRDAFARHGFEVEVAPEIEFRGVGPWVVSALVLAPFSTFFSAMAAAAGKDAYEALKDWVRDVFASRQGAGRESGRFELADPDRTHLEFPSSIPDRAFDALRDIDWTEQSGDWLVWDDERGEWYDPTKRTRR
jgi:hypothetical protein